MTNIDRRALLAAGSSAAVIGMTANSTRATTAATFPKGFMWGASTAGHQIEGNNTASDLWVVENVKPTLFAMPSGDACNSFELWPTDLDLAKHLGLNTYRFSLEWSRIEPEPTQFSIAMLDHYKAIIEGCRKRGLTPVVTFSHFSTPRWFAALGGWTNPDAPNLFARYCDRAARHLATHIGYATTLNEPNSGNVMDAVFPAQFLGALRAMHAAAAQACGSASFRTFLIDPPELDKVQANLLAAHKAGKAAIKAARGDLPVGFNLSLTDDEAVGPNSIRDAKRAYLYGPWLEAAKSDDFLGIQNYSRARWDDKGSLPTPQGVKVDQYGAEVYPPSLANAARFAHEATGVPIFVTEHGVCTADDTIRAWLIPNALSELQKTMADGVPVIGYCHWSLMDNFEWVFGFGRNYGLCAMDRTTFQRTPRPSAAVLGGIAKRNAV